MLSWHWVVTLHDKPYALLDTIKIVSHAKLVLKLKIHLKYLQHVLPDQYDVEIQLQTALKQDRPTLSSHIKLGEHVSPLVLLVT